jgi:hypothetical protein
MQETTAKPDLAARRHSVSWQAILKQFDIKE